MVINFFIAIHRLALNDTQIHMVLTITTKVDTTVLKTDISILHRARWVNTGEFVGHFGKDDKHFIICIKFNCLVLNDIQINMTFDYYTNNS